MATDGIIQINLNPVQVSSPEAFANAGSRLQGVCKDVYFVRCIGYGDEAKYRESIQRLDLRMEERRNGGGGSYLRLKKLDSRMEPEDVTSYRQIYEDWKLSAAGKPGICFHFEDPLRENTMAMAFSWCLEQFRTLGTEITDSMVMNFGIKLFFWADRYLPKLFFPSVEEADRFPRMALSGDIKAQEYLFLSFLTRIGCDVLYLNPKRDAQIGDSLKALSWESRERMMGTVEIPDYVPAKAERGTTRNSLRAEDAAATADAVNSGGSGGGTVRLDRERLARPSRKNSEKESRSVVVRSEKPGRRQELDYEELAKLSPAIVMVSVYNAKGECFKTGSGVVVSEKGYILTNFHVACEGVSYGIRFEEEDKIYRTSELVKYNQLHDLAIIRIDRRCVSVPLYRGSKELVRGQEVVAIGSPLGLFNSVSDGIISGFRVFDAVSMIQFTAPISHGSSGGALLNLYGELIGVITAGFDDGQNINLAVDYKTAATFAGGFLTGR